MNISYSTPVLLVYPKSSTGGNEGHIWRWKAQASQQRYTCSCFPWRSRGRLHNWLHQPRERCDGLLSDYLHWWVHKSFTHFLTFLGWLVALNARHCEHAVDQLETRVSLKNIKECSPKAGWYMSRVSVAGFQSLYAKFDLGLVLEFASHIRDSRAVLAQDQKEVWENYNSCRQMRRQVSNWLGRPASKDFQCSTPICRVVKSQQDQSENFLIPHCLTIFVCKLTMSCLLSSFPGSLLNVEEAVFIAVLITTIIICSFSIFRQRIQKTSIYIKIYDHMDRVFSICPEYLYASLPELLLNILLLTCWDSWSFHVCYYFFFSLEVSINATIPVRLSVLVRITLFLKSFFVEF